MDITNYIDKGARTEKVCMVAPEDQVSPSQLVMKGNQAAHPDAYIIFRIFADTVETIKE